MPCNVGCQCLPTITAIGVFRVLKNCRSLHSQLRERKGGAVLIIGLTAGSSGSQGIAVCIPCDGQVVEAFLADGICLAQPDTTATASKRISSAGRRCHAGGRVFTAGCHDALLGLGKRQQGGGGVGTT